MKVLQFFGEPLSYGGQEAFIINMYKNFKNENIKYTFITPFFANNLELMELIKKRKDTLISFDKDFYSKYKKKYIMEITKKVLKEEKYDVIHIHSGSIFTLYYVSKIAKKNGVKKIIVHSHATGYNNLKHKVIKFLCNIKLYENADYFLACSLKAGEFKYSKKILNSIKFKVLNNGIDLNKFKFDKDTRDRVRKNYCMENKTVICNVGRFSEEKNQLFLLDVFHEYLKHDNNGYLILIGGKGPMEADINEYINKNGINNNVLILKERNDVSDFLNASDIFVFPSIFEGLGISLIEAQATGLFVVCSDVLPVETKVTNNYIAVELNKSAEYWANIIKSHINYRRKDETDLIKKRGFDIKDCSLELERLYMEG